MTTIELPGLIDVHTHLRVPGGEHKEDFTTGTAAAVAGGITMILGMPNTSPPLSTVPVLQKTIATAEGNIYSDVGLFAGASPPVIDQLPTLAPYTAALKIYLNDTFGDLRVDEVPVLAQCFATWPRHKLIAMHAEKQSVAVGIGLSAAYDRPVHFCHISRREEIELIAQAKARGLKVSCEVCPHHLFMTYAETEKQGAFADMRPVLGSQNDVDALWDHINDTIDCIATDHAPHTIAEKQGDPYPPGIIGLQTSLPLMLTAAAEGRISLERVRTMMFDNPKRLYNLPDQPDTHIKVDVDNTFTIRNEEQKSKCGWTPFAGWEVVGRVQKVVLRGTTVFENGQLLEKAGQVIRG